ncbi:MAG: electron transfer flavoprotein subunit alpha/FixB family protein [Saprospiraceae bacterium]|nr:electron transfer flavoprotein subunit alpha/FixB family protein [Saprospiraceae bacterium]
MILVYIEHKAGQVKKVSLEALNLARQIASSEGTSCKAFVVGNDSLSVELGNYGVDEILKLPSADHLSQDQMVEVCSQIMASNNVKYFILGLSTLARSIAGQISIKTQSAMISGITGFRYDAGKGIYRKSVFSGKAFADISSTTKSSVLTVTANCFSAEPVGSQKANETIVELSIPAAKIKIIETKLVQGKTPLTEAAVVVSAGRGMKDPSNWGMIEELADLLGATTACSRPVADVGWRPHHEHVGQTGIAIRPNVYIAIGISGAIQHLAGVNNSRKIIVINKDPEAPFFKAADYGVCGDLFEIIPKLNEALKRLKS